MAWADFFAGLAFYLIIEGLLPFANPRGWRQGLSILGQLKDGQLRSCGLGLVIAGLGLLYLVRG
ncbi:MAG TPA: DUF2065 domain-containing protein [Gammaproteobacteria bacterium]|nr:DUF2065 domain-containing protein [Gammaproteobacteria bacterium]